MVGVSRVLWRVAPTHFRFALPACSHANCIRMLLQMHQQRRVCTCSRSDTVAAFRSDCPFASARFAVERCCRVCIERFRDRSGVSQRCSCYGAVDCSVLSRSCNYFMFRPANSQCFLKRSFSKLKQADGVISGAALRRNSCTLPMHSHMRMATRTDNCARTVARAH